MSSGAHIILVGDISVHRREQLVKICRNLRSSAKVCTTSSPTFFARQYALKRPTVILASCQFLQALTGDPIDSQTVELREPSDPPSGVPACARVQWPSDPGPTAESRFEQAVTSALRLAFKGNPSDSVGEKRPNNLRSVLCSASRISRPPVSNRRIEVGSTRHSTAPARAKLIAIGASTGGTIAIERILSTLPVVGAPVVIAQHIASGFSEPFARRLNSTCEITVLEATDGLPIAPGHAYLAPSDKHLLIGGGSGTYRCVLSNRDRVNRHRPSVDLLFRSVAQVARDKAIGVLLTGMGRDGAEGLLAMREENAHTIVQDEATSIVWGMPGAAYALGAATEVLPLYEIASQLTLRVRQTTS